MGMSTGTVALVARSIGAGRPAEASAIAAQSLVAAAAFGVAAGAVGALFAEPLCRLMGAGPAVAQLGADYLRVSFLGGCTMFLLFIASSILQAAGTAMIPMYAMLLANALNLVLDPVLIFGWLGLPRMGVTGAAVATVISQAVAAAGLALVIARGHSGIRIAPHLREGIRFDVLWRLLRVGIPSSGQMLSRSLMSAVLMRIVAASGTAAVAGYGIGCRFHMLVLMPAFALGNATAPIVGQCLGAGRPGRARHTAWLATGIDALIMAASAAVLMACAAPLIRVFDDNPDVVAVGARYLLIVSPFHIFAALSVVLGRALQGAGDTVAPMVATIVGLWGLQVPLALLFSHWFAAPTDGIWWSVAVTLSVNGATMAGWFMTGRWQAKRV
jgi:putative MATE family efflux protein